MILTHGANSLQVSGGGAVIGGRTYRTVVMPDGKEWLAENLDYKFDGCGIGGTGVIRTPNAWYYNNDEVTYGIDGVKPIGLLYNWYAFKYLEDNKSTLIPGWHTPTEDEWDSLRNVIGSSDAGTKLKAVDNSFGSWPSGWNGTDDYGFGILPGGMYDYPIFENIDVRACFWCSTTINHAKYFSSSSPMSDGGYSEYYAISIRLVKD